MEIPKYIDSNFGLKIVEQLMFNTIQYWIPNYAHIDLSDLKIDYYTEHLSILERVKSEETFDGVINNEAIDIINFIVGSNTEFTLHEGIGLELMQRFSAVYSAVIEFHNSIKDLKEYKINKALYYEKTLKENNYLIDGDNLVFVYQNGSEIVNIQDADSNILGRLGNPFKIMHWNLESLKSDLLHDYDYDKDAIKSLLNN